MTALNIIVGISGGVDSAVAALLLKEQGHHVTGIFMQNWQTDADDPYCTADQDFKDAKTVCEQLQIPLQMVNFAAEYWQRVFQHFLDEYAAGRTPNPDILCNKEIKFKAFLDYARESGADFIATGHYARKDFVNNKYRLLKGVDASKDQSYFLYTLGQEQLQYSLFPVGALTKKEVRAIAARAGLVNQAKKDSTGICFIGERKFKNFLNEYLLAKPGDIIDTENNLIGRHDGLMFYTFGQRQGLGIGGRKGASEAPWYVVKKDIEHNVLVVAQDSNHPWLLGTILHCQDLHWVAGCAPLKASFSCRAKIRYRQEDQECVVRKVNGDVKGDLYKVEFTVPQRAITPGQSVVFYVGEECLGGGVIENERINERNFEC